MNYLTRIMQAACLTSTILSLAACSNLPTLANHEYEYFTPLEKNQRVNDIVTIKWLVENDAAEKCSRSMQKTQNQEPGGRAYITPPVACSIWSTTRKTCTIITSNIVSHTILGHEMRHCFEGHFHDGPTVPKL